MTKYAWVLQVQPGFEQEYERRHAAIWPELLDEIRKAGQRNYVIFRHGLTLIGTFECDDIERVYSVMRDSKVFAKWGEYNIAIVKGDVNPDTGYPYLLPKVWEFEG
ncbi:MAG TPA: L-rhamnose mutarotase [Devosia sp.]|nr:L-rhamnose mutarotase [Devosia sp.]